MGLDMGIYRKVKPDTHEAILDKLEGKDEHTEVAYWRKHWDLQEAIGYIVGEVIENCVEYELDKENLEEIRDWIQSTKDNESIDEWYRDKVDNDVELLNKLIDETDFEKYIYVYSGWW